MTDFDDMRFLRVDPTDQPGEYRLAIFELDPMSEAAEVSDIFEGRPFALAMTIMSAYSDVPIFVRDSEHACNPGEELLACGTRVVEAPRKDGEATLKRAIEINDNPPPKYEDAVPQVTATNLLRMIFSGHVSINDNFIPETDEKVRLKWNDSNDGATILVFNRDSGHEWRFSMDTGVFTRIK